MRLVASLPSLLSWSLIRTLPSRVSCLPSLRLLPSLSQGLYKAEVMQGIKQAVEEMKRIKESKLKGIPAKDLLDEL